jgi:hypothetical protein
MAKKLKTPEDLPQLLEVGWPEDEAEMLDGWPADEAELLKRLRKIAAEITEPRP